MMHPRLELRSRLPYNVNDARTDLWDSGPLWDKEAAKVDFDRVFLAQDNDRESNSFVLLARPFPGIGSWKSLGRFPGQYYQHILLINFMHAWCRDLLELGRWEFLDNVKASIPGAKIREYAMRTMRYLSGIREDFLLCIEHYREDDGDEAFPVSLRLSTTDLHLLALFHDCHFSQDSYKVFLETKSGRDAFSADPIDLGKRPACLGMKILTFYRLGKMAARPNQ
jgi:hypothetical protein